MRTEIKEFLRRESRKRFLRYVSVDTESSETSGLSPSSDGQWNLARMLEQEMADLGMREVVVSDTCYVYGTLPATPGVIAEPLTFCAHMDTSSQESGKGVRPVVHENYDGGEIRFPDNPALRLSPADSPELARFVGDNIITASGKTLLGADDKAGIAEIMAALAAMVRFPELRHPELKIVFTPDEEIGQGIDHIDLTRLAKRAFTMDGGMAGTFQTECFNAYGVTVRFTGVNAHPGDAKNKMINAACVASRFIAGLPESESPRNTQGREGFYHLLHFKGDVGAATAGFIIRDFDERRNLERIEYMKSLKEAFEKRYPGLVIHMEVKAQYKNMKVVLDRYPEMIGWTQKAIEMAGLEPHAEAIRGGTDGSRLCFMGVPTPNLFTGGMMFHSRTEWIAEGAMQKACEVILNICGLSS